MRRRDRGFSIIEFMIAITLSLIVLAALTATFVGNSKARNEIEKTNDQIESGRFALSQMTSDLEMAGFLDRLDVRNLVQKGYPEDLAEQTRYLNEKFDPCSSDLTTLRLAMLLPIMGYNDEDAADASAPVPTCITDRKAGTDIVVLRRVATCLNGTGGCTQVNGAPYFQASACADPTELNSAVLTDRFRLNTSLGSLNRRMKNCSTRAPIRQYLTHVYYVANNDAPGDGIPTLKRVELGGDSDGDGNADLNANAQLVSITPVAHGIENLQVEYGIDTVAADGVPDVYTESPDRYNSTGQKATCTANGITCIENWRNVMTVKVTLLSRNSSATKGFVDDKVYELGRREDGTIKCATPLTGSTCAAFGDAFKRHVYSATIRLNNLAGRRE